MGRVRTGECRPRRPHHTRWTLGKTGARSVESCTALKGCPSSGAKLDEATGQQRQVTEVQDVFWLDTQLGFNRGSLVGHFVTRHEDSLHEPRTCHMVPRSSAVDEP
jgi:hypothetical protein